MLVMGITTARIHPPASGSQGKLGISVPWARSKESEVSFAVNVPAIAEPDCLSCRLASWTVLKRGGGIVFSFCRLPAGVLVEIQPGRIQRPLDWVPASAGDFLLR